MAVCTMRWTGGDSTLNDDVSGMINSYDGDSAGKLHSSILALCASSEDFGKKKNNVKMWLFVHIPDSIENSRVVGGISNNTINSCKKNSQSGGCTTVTSLTFLRYFYV